MFHVKHLIRAAEGEGPTGFSIAARLLTGF
jgi:hypothetical protein